MSFIPGMLPAGAAKTDAGTVQVFPQVLATNHSGTNGLPSSATHNAALPSLASSNLLLLFVGLNAATTISTPSGWTLLFSSTAAAGRLAAFYKISDGTEGATVTVTAGASANFCCVSYALSNYQSAPEAGIAVTNGGVSLSPNPPNLAPSWGSAKTLWFALCLDNGTDTPARTNPTGYGNAVSHASTTLSDNQLTLTTCRRELEAASDNPNTFSIPDTDGDEDPTFSIAQTIAVRPA